MKFLILIIGLILSYAFVSQAFAKAFIINKGIYGDDDRVMTKDLTVEQSFEKKVASVVFAQIPKWRITEETKDSIAIKTKSLASGLNFCPDEKFSDLPVVSSCSAFLVGPDLIMTAGHCVSDKFDCQKNYWVLDYDDASGFVAPLGEVSFSKEKIYSCSKLIISAETPKLDFAIIKLDRAIIDRAPLEVRRIGKVNDFDELAVVGHPLGLPKILASNAEILKNSLPYSFVTNADTFSGNSGSPVINRRTLLVEGILIRGDEDYTMDLDLGCNRSSHCTDFECKGETVQRTSVLPLKLIPRI